MREPAWMADDAPPNSDMWATADETREQIVAFYHRASSHADSTIDALDIGTVPWWGEDSRVTLHQIMVHVVDETSRHVGHADIVRELIDGTVGLNGPNDNLATDDPQWWRAYRRQLEAVANQFHRP